MPRQKDLKRIIRTRMKKTGETYTTARTHVISKAKPIQPPAPRADLSALAGVADHLVASKTGRTWQQWVELLDADNAAAMKHRDIAKLVHEKHGVGDWWTQTVTVCYERIKGLRERGQRRDGTYEAGRSRVRRAGHHAVQSRADDGHGTAVDGVKIVVRTATSPKSMRLDGPTASRRGRVHAKGQPEERGLARARNCPTGRVCEAEVLDEA
jgi:hypothetical protein